MRFNFHSFPEEIHTILKFHRQVILLNIKNNYCKKIVEISVHFSSNLIRILFVSSQITCDAWYHKNSQNYFYIKREIGNLLKNHIITDQQINSVCEKIFEIINN